MKQENIKQLTKTFESFKNQMKNWIEFWFARDLQHLLWYAKWNNFLNIIWKAKTTFETSNEKIIDHFADVGKTIRMPKWAKKEILDIMLTRKACYLIAMNWDTSKEKIAFAQQYFVLQIRKSEIIEKRLLDNERVRDCKKIN